MLDPNIIQPLFRKHAIENISTRQYGTVLLTRSVLHRLLSVLFGTIIVALIAFFMLFSTARKVQCAGMLIPSLGALKVVTTQTGLVLERRVHEGQYVNSGDVLFVLSGERSTTSADATQNVISKLLRERRSSFAAELKQSGLQSAQRIAAARHRIQDMAAELAHLDNEIELQGRRIKLSEEAQQRFRQLRDTQYISQAQFEEKQGELLEQRQRLAGLERQRVASRRDLATATADRRDFEVQAQREANALERNASAVEQDLVENEARREILVRTPKAGMVTAIMAEVGQTVIPGNSMATLLPAGAVLEAEIYVPSRSVGFILPGMKVLLRYQAYPYQKFGQHKATVREIANTALRPEELALPGTAMGAESLYRIRLSLEQQAVKAYGKAMPLKSGMQVDASVLLERRRLYEWSKRAAGPPVKA